MANKMAAKKKPQGAKSPKDAAEDVKSFSGELPKKTVIVGLQKTIGKLMSDSASIRGQIGSEIKNAEADHNVHRGALREVLKMAKMDPEKRADYIRHRDSYALQLGLGVSTDLFQEDESPADKATFGGRNV